MVGAVGEMASMKRRKLWKTGEDGLCCSSSAIQTRLGLSSLLEERSETPIVFVCFFCVVGYPPNWGKRPRYIDIDRILLWFPLVLFFSYRNEVMFEIIDNLHKYSLINLTFYSTGIVKLATLQYMPAAMKMLRNFGTFP